MRPTAAQRGRARTAAVPTAIPAGAAADFQHNAAGIRSAAAAAVRRTADRCRNSAAEAAAARPDIPAQARSSAAARNPAAARRRSADAAARRTAARRCVPARPDRVRRTGRSCRSDAPVRRADRCPALRFPARGHRNRSVDNARFVVSHPDFRLRYTSAALFRPSPALDPRSNDTELPHLLGRPYSKQPQARGENGDDALYQCKAGQR